MIVPAPKLAPTEAGRRWAALLQQIFEVDPPKLAAGQYRYLVQRDDGHYRIIKDDDRMTYLNRDADRMDGALGLLADLGYLVHPRGPAAWVTITPAGRRRWRRIAKAFS